MAIMQDGFSTTLAFSADSTVQMQIKEITPPGVTQGGPIDTTTMSNSEWRTMWPKSLKTLSPISMVVVWDPMFYTELWAMLDGAVGNQQITVFFPNGDSLVFWGFIDEFTPNAHTEGEQPTANMTVVPSNQDDSGSEVAPNYIAA